MRRTLSQQTIKAQISAPDKDGGEIFAGRALACPLKTIEYLARHFHILSELFTLKSSAIAMLQPETCSVCHLVGVCET